ncbi:MAG TPA: aminoglycoside phosphotransferase family protein [Gemmatimonadales bacterium]|nr:aminoglycoside phosphotransferase family protein [Gemmatimonadales bacterium]
MNAPPTTVSAADIGLALAAALRAVHGADGTVETWSAHPLSKRGKHRVVRYDVQARAAGGAEVHYQWVGKFYERDEDACGVATTLRELTASGWGARGGFVVPSVLAYHAAQHLLLLSHEAGESVVKAIAADGAPVLAAIGRALAVLHVAPVMPATVTAPAAVLADLQRRILELCGRFPAEAASLQRWRVRLEREAAPPPPTSSFLHGDLGLVQLRWQAGTIVFLDFDDCTLGDPALDLGNLLTQLRRLTLRKPGKLPDFDTARTTILDAYQCSSPSDPGLAKRVAWYEQVALARKIHSLTFDQTRHPEAEAIRARQGEAIHLLASVL